MTDLVKIPQRQDCGLKISKGNSGETSINLSTEIAELLVPNSLPDKEYTIEVCLYKEDFIKALCFIIQKLPLYKSSSKTYTELQYSNTLFTSYIKSINDFFGTLDCQLYNITFLHRKDERFYLKGLKDSKSDFNLRNFIVEQHSLLRFINNSNENVTVRLENGDNINTKEESSYIPHLLIEDHVITKFVDKIIPIVLDYDKNLSMMNPFFEPTGKRLNVKLNTSEHKVYCLGYTDENARQGDINLNVKWLFNNKIYYLYREIYKPDFLSFIERFNECYQDTFKITYTDDNKYFFYRIGNEVNANNHPKFNTSTNLNSYLPIIRTKPFLLLAGISGTGKSRIVKEMAFNSCPEDEELRKDEVSPGNYLLVEVKPNWHDSTELMGYESGIKKTYVTTPFIKFLYKAMHYPNTPFFVCLDEMNLAPVEQYFAEFLSVLESRKRSENEEIVSEPLISADVFTKYPDLYYDLNGIEKGQDTSHPAYGGKIVDDTITDYNQTDEVFKELCQYGLRIPHNVIVIGTVNMDETTHQFSRKVIDRAMTIEMNEVHFDSFFESNQDLGYTSTPLNASSFLAKFTSAKQALEYMQPQDADYIKSNLPSLLEGINDCLENTPFKIAYRVQNEIILYFAALREDDATAKSEILLNQALDDILMMKVLPRIEGDDELLEEPLKDLLAFSTNLPKSKVKVEEMQSRLGIGHFTSFWP